MSLLRHGKTWDLITLFLTDPHFRFWKSIRHSKSFHSRLVYLEYLIHLILRFSSLVLLMIGRCDPLSFLYKHLSLIKHWFGISVPASLTSSSISRRRDKIYSRILLINRHMAACCQLTIKIIHCIIVDT